METSKNLVVVDLETTGFASKSTDRVVEIGIVELNGNFEPVAQWSTLVNPKRDAGARHIHGIESKWLTNAPAFEEIADPLLELLESSVVVAHNAIFDVNFLMSEFKRAGLTWEPEADNVVDTLALAKWVLGERQSLKLPELCQHFGIANEREHAALADALATGELLKNLCGLEPGLKSLFSSTSLYSKSGAPALSQFRDLGKGRPNPSESLGQLAFIPALVAALPLTGDKSPNDLEYLAMLHAAFEDSELSHEEVASLTDLAASLDFSIEEISKVHQSFFGDLANRAWSDGVLADHEWEQIQYVGQSLGINAIDIEVARTGKGRKPEVPQSALPLGLSVGDSVVLTGEMVPSKTEIAKLLENAGLVVKTGVSKKVRLVIAADAHSMSGKASAARKLGITVISTELFVTQWR